MLRIHKEPTLFGHVSPSPPIVVPESDHGSRPNQLEATLNWIAGAPASILIAGWFTAQLLLWLPQYLTWPIWSDHDVFATAAFGWKHGMLPYRDLLSNNFPGQTYEFFALGELFGWGRPAAFRAFDAMLLIAFSGVMLLWSRRSFGRLLPGWITLGAIFAFYFTQNYPNTAQRDWHAALFALTSVMIPALLPSKTGSLVSGVIFSAALSLRPQALLFLPAVVKEIVASHEPPASADVWKARQRWLLLWCGAALVGVLLWLFPLWHAGVLGDFFGSLRTIMYGGAYNQKSAADIVRALQQQMRQPRFIVPALLLAVLSQQKRNQAGWVMLTALFGAFLYAPISPHAHFYLLQPLVVTTACSLAPITALAMEGAQALPIVRLAILGLLVLTAAPAWPQYSDLGRSAKAIRWLWKPPRQPRPPAGYLNDPEMRLGGEYLWKDYVYMLEAIRNGTSPDVRVANALQFLPAVTGVVRRLPAFPAESI